MDETSFENSRVGLNKEVKNDSKMKTNTHFFIEDVEDQEDLSPTKLNSKIKMNGEEIIRNPEKEAHRNNRKKSAKPAKLQPLKAAEAYKIEINDIEDKKKSKQKQEEEEEEDDEIEQIKIKRSNKKKRDQGRKILVFDDEDQANSDHLSNKSNQEEKKQQIKQKNNRNRENSSQNESDPQPPRNQSREPRDQILSEDQPTNIQGFSPEVRTMINPEDEMSFVVRRDNQWLSKIRPQFNIHHFSNNEYFFSAKMTSSNATSTIIFSTSKTDFSENSPSYIGKMKGNFTGSEYNIYGPGYNPSDAKDKKLPLRNVLATVQYETNYFGSARPRNFKAYVLKPKVSYYDDLIGVKKFSDEVSLNELYEKSANKDKILVFENKKPEWNEEIQGYMLNFGGKVKKASIKNFILQDENNTENNRMVFGKIEEDEFRMDVGHPLSPFLAIGISLSAFGSKIGCQ